MLQLKLKFFLAGKKKYKYFFSFNFTYVKQKAEVKLPMVLSLLCNIWKQYEFFILAVKSHFNLMKLYGMEWKGLFHLEHFQFVFCLT